MTETKSGPWANRSTESMMGFARLDDCLEMMVPSDLREIVGRLAREEAEHEKTLEDRDRLHEWADKLAQAIGGEDIGWHSNLNNPWANAIEIAEANARLMDEMLKALTAARIYIACQRPVVGFARKAQAEVLAKIDRALPLNAEALEQRPI